MNSLVFELSQFGYREFVPIVISRHDSLKVLPSLKLTANAPDNWCLNWLNFGAFRPIFRDELSYEFHGVTQLTQLNHQLIQPKVTNQSN